MVFEVQIMTSSGGGHAEPQTRRGWAPAERPRAGAQGVHRARKTDWSSASTASGALRVTSVWLLPRP